MRIFSDVISRNCLKFLANSNWKTPLAKSQKEEKCAKQGTKICFIWWTNDRKFSIQMIKGIVRNCICSVIHFIHVSDFYIYSQTEAALQKKAQTIQRSVWRKRWVRSPFFCLCNNFLWISEKWCQIFKSVFSAPQNTFRSWLECNGSPLEVHNWP